MLLAISYANDFFKKSQKLNSKYAKKYGADKVIEYSYDKLPEDFKNKYSDFFKIKRGNGYWIWKPFIIMDALNQVEDGDYVMYSDSGCVLIDKLDYLLSDMNKANVDVMCFCIDRLEGEFTKRDAFILMDCDEEKYVKTQQICTTYIIIRKNAETVSLIEEYMRYESDFRIVSDDPNVMGQENYPGFIGNRHDQTVWSLLCKKHNIFPFRDPSEYGNDKNIFTDEVNARSSYPQVFFSHRVASASTMIQARFWYSNFGKKVRYYLNKIHKR